MIYSLSINKYHIEPDNSVELFLTYRTRNGKIDYDSTDISSVKVCIDEVLYNGQPLNIPLENSFYIACTFLSIKEDYLKKIIEIGQDNKIMFDPTQVEFDDKFLERIFNIEQFNEYLSCLWYENEDTLSSDLTFYEFSSGMREMLTKISINFKEYILEWFNTPREYIIDLDIENDN